MRSLYNPALKWVYSMVPALMAASFCFPAIAAALACTRERENGSYEGLLSSPVKVPEYVLGKLLPYLGVGTLGAALAWGVAILWFGVPFRGSILGYLLLALVFLLSLLSVSILIGNAAANQRQAIIAIVLVFFLPTFFMSGMIQPLEPGSTQTEVLKRVLPAANYVTINRGVFLKGMSPTELRPEITNLLRVCVVALTASLIVTRRKVA
jgi:ABC-type multidrug transport system permease subunit